MCDGQTITCLRKARRIDRKRRPGCHRGKKQRLESVLETFFGPLLKDEVPNLKVPSCGVKTIQTMAKDLGLDASLLQTVPAVFAKAPGGRGSFDNVVIEQIEAEFQKCMVAFTDELANGEPAKKERAAKMEAASGEHAQALASEQAARSAKEPARAAHKEAEIEYDARVKERLEGTSDVGFASEGVDAAKAELTELHEGPLSAFKELLEFTEIPPPVAPAPVPEDPATAADAAEPAADAPEQSVPATQA